MKKKLKILLLTHITADNLGDQTIEICARGLLQVAMKNLGISEEEYEIISEDAGFINKPYLAIHAADRPKKAEQLIQESDLIVFGGAPMFNYLYEGFADRTARTLKIIKKYSKPVIFSAIGVENFDPQNSTCRSLKKELNDPCVKMVTTRDNYPALKQFIDLSSITTAKVSDPAVFSFAAFSEYIAKSRKSEKKKIGLFVIRDGAFKDNQISFSSSDSIRLWKNFAAELVSRGYDYEYLTSGSHADEAFLHRLVVDHGIASDKCAVSMNTPEDLVTKIASYDGVIACRLHPSIISYSLKIPTIGIVWNNKVSSFYENIGYSDRIFHANDLCCKTVIDRLESAMSEGVHHEEEFLMTSYRSLFLTLKQLLCPHTKTTPYAFSDVVTSFPRYQGSNLSEKISRKLARLYKSFNRASTVSRKRNQELEEAKEQYSILLQKYNMLDQKLNEIYTSIHHFTDSYQPNDVLEEKKLQKFPVFYNIGRNARSMKDNVDSCYQEGMGKIMIRPRSLELVPANQIMQNNGTACFHENVFKISGFQFTGWRLRVGVGKERYLLLEDSTFVQRDQYNAEKHGPYKLFQPGEPFPVIPLYGISNCVAEGNWEPSKSLFSR